ncbi:Desumoylating isopeptidase 1 [Symbiodinium microadriaticum]|uniref:Desumoylating isopeptidase 1 n=1 Tax=Symbiodinium microadriaticum TaxID=2951 RepID=A0A1Q9EJF5_SYMMI|nr:Desumoylating isopeptidase 1 [Symbiodinium microadriaticum]
MGNVTSGCWPSHLSDVRPPDADPAEGEATNQVELATSLLFTIPGLASAYHTSVVVNGEEFFFSDSGIFANMTLTSHQGKPSEKLAMGLSHWTGQQLFRALQEHFRPGTYDLIRKNCNSFSDCALHFLLRKRLPSKYSAMESMGQRTSLDLIHHFTNGAYQPNQAAANFSTETVIQQLDRLDPRTLAAGSTAGTGKNALRIGAPVAVCGLKNAEHLNGLSGRIVGYNSVNGRWEAKLSNGDTKALRAENLRPEGERVYLPGDKCRIHSLQSDAGKILNGRVGEVNRYIHDVSRSGLPLTMCEGQGISFKQVVHEFHGILLLMQVLPICKQRPPCGQIRNQLLPVWSILTWMSQDRVNGTFQLGGTPGGAVWCM